MIYTFTYNLYLYTQFILSAAKQGKLFLVRSFSDYEKKNRSVGKLSYLSRIS